MYINKNSFLILFSAALSVCGSCQAQQSNLSVPQFEQAIGKNSIQILDVRTPGEYNSGFIEHAMLADWNNELEFKERVKSLDKDKPVYTYCLSGARSASATTWLNQHGFIAYNLAGGINAWKKNNLPLKEAVVTSQMSLQEYLANIPADKTVLVDFGAVWCPPCKKMGPVIDSLVVTNGHQFRLIKIDGGNQASICKELLVDGFPTFIVYKAGKEVWRKEGIVDRKEFIAHF